MARSTCILAFAICCVSYTCDSVNCGVVRNGGIFNDTPAGRRSLIKKPLSASIKRGGVAIFTKKGLPAKELHEIKTNSIERDIEICGIKLGKKFIISIYRSPDGNLYKFNEGFYTILEKIKCSFTNVFIAGDYNINFMQTSTIQTEFEELCASFGYHVLTREASRVTCNTKSCIDNIITNTQSDTQHVRTINLHLADHFGQLLTIDSKNIFNQSSLQRQRLISRENILKFESKVRENDWISVLEGLKSDFNKFHKRLLEIFEQCFPIVVRRWENVARKPVKWWSKELRQMKYTLEALWVINQVKKDQPSSEIYKRYKKEYLKKAKDTKRFHITREINESDNKQKTVWKVIKRESNRTQITSKDGNITVEELNDFFTSIGEHTSAMIPQASCPYSLLQNMSYTTRYSLFFQPTTKEEVMWIVHKMKNKATPDAYGFSVKILKIVIPYIADAVSIMINNSFLYGHFPDLLKKARIAPIYKSGDRNDLKNYRPVSILPTLSKIWEVAIRNRIEEHFDSSSMWNENHHGFRRQRSTITAGASILGSILEAFDKNLKIEAAFCDLSKAFDTVDHRILLGKLSYYGIRGVANKIMESYLTDRTQYTEWNNGRSGESMVHVGVPQGSVLGPLLYIIYTNDLPINVQAAITLQYADDTSFLNYNITEEGLHRKTVTSMQDAEIWFNSNKVMLNREKTKIMKFCTRLEGERETVKFLGIVLDSTLTFQNHVQYMSGKLSSIIYTIRVLNRTATYEAARQAYFSLFHSAATYGILLWGASPHARKIFIKQKEAVRALYKLNSKESCRNVFKSNILTIPAEYIFVCIMYVHERKEQWEKGSNVHCYKTRNAEEFRPPKRRLRKTQHGIDYVGVRLYNKLPEYIKIMSRKTFKKTVKSVLLNGGFYSVDEYLEAEIV